MDTTNVSSQPDERAEPRTPLQIPTAILSDHFATPVEVECTDLSARGMYLASDLLLAPGDRVLVAFIPPGTWHQIVADAEVVRTSLGSAPGMGLRFDHVPRVDATILRAALGRRGPAAGDPTAGALRQRPGTDGAWRC